MQRLKRLIPNQLKQEFKYLFLKMLKIPYSRTGVPVELLGWLPKDRPITFMDIGASVGQFSMSLARSYAIERGIIVEPLTRLIPVLENNFPDRKKFQIVNMAISDTVAETDFYINEDAHFVSSLLRIRNKGEEFAALNFADPVKTKIKTITLDQLAKEQQLNHLDLLKIDVQGAEHLVLNSGSETLKKTRLVYTEFSFKPLYENSSTFFDLYNIFYQNNFILVATGSGYSSNQGELIQGDALFVNKALIG